MEKQLAICKECSKDTWIPIMNKDHTEHMESQAFPGFKYYECTNCAYVEMYNDEYEVKIQAPVIGNKERYYHTQIVEFLNELEYSLMDPGIEISDDDKNDLDLIQHIMGQYIGKIPADDMEEMDEDFSEKGIHPDPNDLIEDEDFELGAEVRDPWDEDVDPDNHW